MRSSRSAKVIRISLDDPLEPVVVEERYTGVLIVVMSRGSIIAEIRLPAIGILSKEFLRRLIAHRCGEALWRQHLASTFLDATRGPSGSIERGAAPTVSVIVCTRDRSDQLRDCLQSLLALDPPAAEILVVDNSPSDEATRLVCDELPVRYVLEPLPGQSRARNRGIIETTGDLVAFTDDDCLVDPGWLNRLEETFADSLVDATTGYVGPAELETPSQIYFELHGGFGRGLSWRVFDGSIESPVRVVGRAGAGANMIIRRSAFGRLGLFAEDLGPGTPARAADETDLFYRILARGGRIVFDPSRIVWHRHRGDPAALRKIFSEYGIAVSAFATRSLLRYREPAALSVLGWWGSHLWRNLVWILRREPRRIPFRAFLAEVAGTLKGPWELGRSRRSRRGIPPLALPVSGESERPGAAPVMVSAASPPISVVIPSHNRRELLGRVLLGLATQTYPAERFETVLVLDNCTDGSAELACSLLLPYPLRLVEHDARNSAASRNRGVREAVNPVVVLLDDDVVPDADTLAAHGESHRLALGRQAALGDCPPWIEGRSPWELSLRNWWGDYYRRRAEPGHRWAFSDFASANASLDRTTLLEHPYDEAFPGRREDWELGLRLLDEGVSFAHCPGARAWHYLDPTFTTALEHRREDGRADARFAAKHPHVSARLPLAAFLWSVDNDWLHERVRLACEDPGRAERRIRSRLRRLDLVAALHLRRRWRRQARRLFREAYVLGLADELGSSAGVTRIASSIFRQGEVTRVSLDAPDPLGFATSPTSAELEVVTAGSIVGRVVAVDPGAQWDWLNVTERVVGAVGDEAREAAVLAALDRVGGPRLLSEQGNERVEHAR